ncbi:MAG TPA: hypothetical protein DG753_03425 [Clostridium sp.]|nr:hypothetical protein [Clostridium sp.]
MQPPIISTANKLNSIKYSNNCSLTTPNLSILDTNLKNVYDNITTAIYDSQNSKNTISKETYLLLSIQSLIDFITKVCNEFINDINKKSNEINLYSTEAIINLFNSLFSISKSLKLLNALIGQSIITPKYSDKILNELSAVLFYVESYTSNLYKNKLDIDNDTIDLINSTVNQCKELLALGKTLKIVFFQFVDLVFSYINCINLLTNQLTHLDSSASQESLSNITSSLQKIIKLIELVNSSVSWAYSSVVDNYNKIINNLKYACNCIKSISFISQSPNLFTNFSSNILLVKSYSKDLTNTQIDYPLDINNFLINTDITEDIILFLSFYVYNLHINISGTINSINFTGIISYPGLHNLNFFGINDTNINTKISIPSNTTKFNISQLLTLDLKIKNIKVYPQYNTSLSSSFNADINFNLLVNGEIVVTSLIPLIIIK